MLSQETFNQAIVSAVKSRLAFPHYRIFLFGSRATGKAGSRSDFDIGIDAGKAIPLDVIFKIKDDLEAIPMLQKIDLVDFSSVSADFARRAEETIKIIYEQ